MMIQQIRTGKFSKVLSCYLAIQLVLTTIQPTQLFALTGGPSQPEFTAFTPIGTSDMVNINSGSFNYNIPIMDVGGYPLNLAYDAGITMDQEASWVGLGWNLNVGQINRNVRGIPDDFKGDTITYENSMKKNKTVGMTLSINSQISGFEFGSLGGNASATLVHNNYDGFSFTPSFGVSYRFSSGTSVGMNLSPSVENGASVTPIASQGLDKQKDENGKINDDGISNSLGIGTTFNSRQGLSSFNINTSTSKRVSKRGDWNKGNLSDSYDIANLSFIDNTFTPAKRTAYHNENYTFRASLGPDFWATSLEAGVSAFYSVQKLKYEEQQEKAYGYEFTRHATHNDILDFNRENERMVSKNTTTLPVVNYTHDIYHIQGQGIAGQFRPFKSQSGYVFNQRVEDSGNSFSLGAEIEGATGFHVGVDIHYSPTRSHTGVWDTPGRYRFQSSNTNDIDYEETYFKTIGDLGIDKDQQTLYEAVLSAEKPMSLVLSPVGNSYGKQAMNVFNVKEYNLNNTIGNNSQVTITEPIKRKHREQRNQAILKVNKKEALVDPFINAHTNLEPHHTNGLKIVQPSGATYVYGEAAVNHSKEEVTFATEGTTNLEDGTVKFLYGEDERGNESGFDNYFNKITTPDYAHTYLLTTVLSNDYEDLTGDGATDDDLGAYTKMHYNNFINDTDINGAKITSVVDDYKWRVPYAANDASYNPGLYTKENDQKGSYVRGEKELKYATMIETKTHVAIFDFSPREDGLDADGRNASLKIDAIRLYSKPEAKAANLLDDDDSNNQFVAPIKTAHFTYNYSLMPETPNSDAIGKGKLTLERVHFTYRNSNMGKYTPYVFNYDNMNPDYQIKSYDVWGNYKPLFENGVTKVDTDNDGIYDDVTLPTGNINTSCEVLSDITAQEFPFVQQKDKELQDLYTAAWTLSSVDLPSGGRIELEYESDDYQYVQNKPAMEMFKVVGVSRDVPNSTGDLTNRLYTNGQHTRFLTVELPETEQIPIDDFKTKYLGEYIDNPLFFRFLLNMEKHDVSACSYDYVEGYCHINQAGTFKVFKEPNGKVYGAIPILLEQKEGGADASIQVILEHPTVQIGADTNPITKSGWFFARKHLNRYALGTGDDTPSSTNINDITNAIFNTMPILLEFFNGPNGYLETRNIARKFNPEKSWIRLRHPSKSKLGGGLRVKKVMMHDNWDVMIENVQANPINAYSNFYGQEYDYTLGENLGSSGVATWEPNMSKENPLLQPFFDSPEKLQAREYVEMPFGKSFYPSATVTYSKVTVKNLDRINLAENKIVKKHATGKVTSTFYTSKDFPTKSDHTNIDGLNNYVSNQANILDNVLRLSVRTELALSQGFSIITNDMNGKSKSQEIYDENGNFISGVDNIYNVTDNGELDNKLPVILADGTIDKTKEIGVHYDVITDFNENYNLSESYGVDTNLTFFTVGIWPILLGQLPFEYKRNESILHTTTTTKVIHKTGILVEKVAHDLGASVSTKNLAWDALSGQVLLTETSNAYEDNYYNFSYPAHWAYKGMGQTVTNLGVECRLTSLPENLSTDYDGDEDGNSTWYKIQGTTSTNSSLDELFTPGDQVMVFDSEGESISDDNAYWISQVENIGATSGKKMVLIDRNGAYLNACGEDVNLSDITIKIVKSSYKNFQSAAMASVTSMKSPISDTDTVINADDFSYNGTGTDPRIINASAVEYKDFWLNPEENIGVERYPSVAFQNSNQHLIKYPAFHTTNPFLYNIKGDWRAVKSYAYLTTRSSTSTKRNSGFFEKFDPFYRYDTTTEKWIRNTDANNEDDWTYASEVTQYSPYGAELENRDALGRHSAAQYGYNYKLPVAVASNSEYRQMGYEGFEDRDSEDVINSHFRISNYATNANDVFVTEEESHTGRFSLKVEGGKRAFINKKLYNDCLERAQRLDCAPLPPPPPQGDLGCSVFTSVNPDNNSSSVYGTVTAYYGADGPGAYPNTNGKSIRVIASSQVEIYAPNYDGSNVNHPITFTFYFPSTGLHTVRYEIIDGDGDTCLSDPIFIEDGAVVPQLSGTLTTIETFYSH